MALFSTREVCNYQVESAYDPRAVCIIPDQKLVVVGTLSGKVQLFSPNDQPEVNLKKLFL